MIDSAYENKPYRVTTLEAAAADERAFAWCDNCKGLTPCAFYGIEAMEVSGAHGLRVSIDRRCANCNTEAFGFNVFVKPENVRVLLSTIRNEPSKGK